MALSRCSIAALALAFCVSAGATEVCASQLTDAFVANIKPNVDFLDRASRLALKRTSSRAVKAYAQDVAARETIVANTIVAWWQSNTVEGADSAFGITTPAKPRDPVDSVAGSVTSLVDGTLLTGRSVAVAESPRAAPAKAAPLLPSQDADYATLDTLGGRRFDAFYKLTQRNSLRQLAALYRDYASRGDDPALRSLSILQLDKTNETIRQLNALR